MMLSDLGVWAFRNHSGPPQPLLTPRQHISEASSPADKTPIEVFMHVRACARVCVRERENHKDLTNFPTIFRVFFSLLV